MNNKVLLENLRCIPDFPKKGINFRDVTTLYKIPANAATTRTAAGAAVPCRMYVGISRASASRCWTGSISVWRPLNRITNICLRHPAVSPPLPCACALKKPGPSRSSATRERPTPATPGCRRPPFTVTADWVLKKTL